MAKFKQITLIALLALTFLKGNSQPLKLEQLKENTFVIKSDGKPSATTLAWSKYPDSWENQIKIESHKSPDTLNLMSAHPFIKSTLNGKDYYCSQRLISLEGAVNFRDLGGYATKDGKQVKWGKIYRSADISKLTDEDLNVLSALHIKIDCDLRGDKEVEVAPDKIPSETERISLPAGSENVGAGISSYVKYMKNEASADSMITAMYSKTDHLQKKYKPMFDHLLSLGTDEALLFHCSAGKDRTGIGAALILYSLGVNEDVIYQDYEATNLYRKASNEQYIKALSTQGVSEKGARRLMAADRKYLKATFDSLKRQYGSVEYFLQLEIGLTTEKVNILRKICLY